MFDLPRLFRHVLLLTGLVGLVGCGTLEIGFESETKALRQTTANDDPVTTTQVTPAETPVVGPTITPAVGVGPIAGDDSRFWAEYRHPEHGYGLAMPCYWQVTKTPSGSINLTSYDDVFFADNSGGGRWLKSRWPDRAILANFTVYDDVDPALSLVEAAGIALRQRGAVVETVEEITIGPHQAVMLLLGGVPVQEDPSSPRQLILFRLAPDKLLQFAVWPREALLAADVQAMLASVVLAPEEMINRPVSAPDQPVDGRVLYVNESNGYCLTYPSGYIMEESLPGQPDLVGTITTLRMERDAYYDGVVIEAQSVSAESDLGELVNTFLSEHSDWVVGLTDRYAVDLGGETADVLVGFAGRPRDVFALHDEKLYHLFFAPSLGDFPQAQAGVERLYGVVTGSFSFVR